MTVPGTTPRVLVVEDAPPTRVLMETALALVGCVVESTGDGADALARAIADPPDAIVLDIAIPTIDGWEVLRQLRAHEATRRVPVVIATAHAAVEHHDRAQGMGAEAFIDKPFNPVDLQRTVLSVARRGE